MTYLELYRKAECMLARDDITLGEYEKMIEPLNDVVSGLKRRRHGQWEELDIIDDEDDQVEAWQSARCSVCKHYHTTPFIYYFKHYRFCPFCGADMGGNNE